MRVFAGVVFEKILVFNISGATKTTKEDTGTMNNDTSHQTKSTEINFNPFLKNVSEARRSKLICSGFFADFSYFCFFVVNNDQTKKEQDQND